MRKIFLIIVISICLLPACAKNAKQTPPPNMTLDEKLYFFIKVGNLDEVKKAVNKGIDIHDDRKISIDERYPYITPMYYAAINGHLHIVKYLYSIGATVETNSYSKYTALIYAAKYGHFDIVKYLVSIGSNVIGKTRYDESALDLAKKNGHSNIVKYLSSKKIIAYGNLQKSIKNKDLNGIKNALKNGADINTKYQILDGASALNWGCSFGYENIVIYLINNGADINSANKQGETPLMRAALSDYYSIVTFLLSKGADVNVHDNLNRDALIYASMHNHFNVAKLLVEKGSKLQTQEIMSGYTAVMFCIGFEDKRLKNYLVSEITKSNNEEEVNYNFVNDVGYSVLMLAAGRGNYELVKYLINHGADVNYKSKNGWTALDVAEEAYDMEREYDHKIVIMILKRAGAISTGKFKN